MSASATTPAMTGLEGIAHDPRPVDNLWRSLYYFNLYRLVLSGSLLTLALTGAKLSHFGERQPALFLAAGLVLAAFSVVNLITITRGRPPFAVQANFQIVTDIVVLLVLMHASNGVDSGLGLLLIVSVAAGAVVLSRRLTLFYAALATLLMLLEHALSLALGHAVSGSYAQAAFLGVGLFATALIISGIAGRARITEALAHQRALDLVHLDQLNRRIVERLDLGVVAVDADGAIQLLNDKAREFLEIPAAQPVTGLTEIESSLADDFARWRATAGTQAGIETGELLRVRGRNSNVAARFVSLAHNTLIFLEDTSRVHEEKLAALGRLTTAIAHEIRNPLAALSHAAQLLSEGDRLSDEEQRLLNIVQQQGERINRVVENVLYLGRRGPASVTRVPMKRWLDEFLTLFCETRHTPRAAIAVEGADFEVSFDTDQLNQILYNLCSNALRHSSPFEGAPLVRLALEAPANGRAPSLDIVDSGSGISPEIREEIFEPFFTTSHRGTGLGLYMARELCEANGARLELVPEQRGARFRINFPDAGVAQPA